MGGLTYKEVMENAYNAGKVALFPVNMSQAQRQSHRGRSLAEVGVMPESTSSGVCRPYESRTASAQLHEDLPSQAAVFSVPRSSAREEEWCGRCPSKTDSTDPVLIYSATVSIPPHRKPDKLFRSLSQSHRRTTVTTI